MSTMVRIALVLALLSAAVFAEDISGKWIFNVETTAGSGTPTFVFKQDGEKLTGSYNGTFGSAELKGTVKGSDVEFSFETTVGDQKSKVVYKGKIEGPGKMKGSADYGGLGEATWTGSKQ